MNILVLTYLNTISHNGLGGHFSFSFGGGCGTFKQSISILREYAYLVLGRDDGAFKNMPI